MFQIAITRISHFIVGLALLLTAFTTGAQEGSAAKSTQDLEALKIELPPPHLCRNTKKHSAP